MEAWRGLAERRHARRAALARVAKRFTIRSLDPMIAGAARRVPASNTQIQRSTIDRRTRDGDLRNYAAQLFFCGRHRRRSNHRGNSDRENFQEPGRFPLLQERHARVQYLNMLKLTRPVRRVPGARI